jgi:hypothetical protein
MLEKQIEKAVCDYARAKGAMALKFNSMARAAVPDRLFIYRGKMWFCEFKRTGQVPTPPQEREHARLREHDVKVYVIDNVEDGRRMVNAECLGCL